MFNFVLIECSCHLIVRVPGLGDVVAERVEDSLGRTVSVNHDRNCPVNSVLQIRIGVLELHLHVG